MTAADVRDILQLPQAGPSAPKPKSKSKKSTGKRMDGMTRELYSLMGDNAPAITLALPKMKERPKLKQKAVPWELTAFSNSARKDGLQLLHWAPARTGEAAQQDYKFAVFNTSSNVYSYSTEEYQKFLRDAEWSREETDYLFQLCTEYDLRFIIIHDRYEWPDSTRSLEDLKDRYYTCCRRLIRERPASDEASKQSSANSYAFDKAREVARKEYLRSLMSRTPAQIAEEEFLYVESRKLEQTYSKVAKEREDLLRLLGGPGYGAPMPGAGAATASLPTGSIILNKSLNRRRSGRPGFDDDSLEGTPASSGPSGKGGKKVKVDPVYDAEHFIARLEPNQSTSFGVQKSYNHMVGGPSVCLRSTRLPLIKQALQPRVLGALAELGISQRLVMPTIVNQDRLETLVDAVGLLVDVKRQLDRAEYEMTVAKNRTIHSVDAEGESVDDSASVAAESESGIARKRSASVASSVGSTKPPKKRKRQI